MPRRNPGELVHFLQRLSGSETAQGTSDAELLDRYVRSRDQAAIELLVWRHSVLVFNVCRRILPSHHDAEDAFQATFLALVRKAHAILRRGSVASWLYKVAYRVALEVRERAQKIARREMPGSELLEVQAIADPGWNEVQPILDEEIHRLPERLRQPFILCYLEGKTNEEAARQLGCPAGTVFSRLARGREMLRQRLQRRGVALSATALAATLGQRAAEAVPAAPLVRAALRFADGQAAACAVPAEVTKLAEGVLQTMFLTRLKIGALLLFVVLGLLAGGGTLLQRALTAAPPAPDQQEESAALPAAEKKKEQKKPVVQVVQPTPGGLERVAVLPGHVRPAAQQQVTSAVSGYLKRLIVGIGDRVKRGEVLAEIDAPLLQLEAKQAAVAVVVAEGQVVEAKARVATATAELKASHDLIAQREAEILSTSGNLAFVEKKFARMQQLANQKSVDKALVDEQQQRLHAAQGQNQKAQAALAGARSELAVQESKIEIARAAMESAKANVTIAKLAQEKAQVQVGYTALRSGFDGVVTQVNFNVGDFIKALDSGLSQPLLTVQRVDVVRVVADVPQTDVLLTRPGVPVDLTEDDLKLSGLKVSRIGFAVNEKTATMPIEIDVPNPENRLRPGMFTRVTLHLAKGKADAFTVPEAALVQQGDLFSIYVVRDGKAHLTRVGLGRGRDGQVEILSGVQASDRIVINPNVLKGAAEGVPVEVKKGP